MPDRATTQHRVCALCGERVGVYEPAVVELRDGTIVTTSPASLGAAPREQIVRIWHAACHAAA